MNGGFSDQLQSARSTRVSFKDILTLPLNEVKAGVTLDVNRVNAVCMNVTVSLFHLTNYEHVKHVPYYKISTPKSPIYTLEEERDRESAVANKTK